MTEGLLEVGGTIPALLVFADIVDSSKYSAVLGRLEYAKRLLEFQKLFKTVGQKYFPEPSDPTQEFCKVNARGDEGTIFFATCTEVNLSETVFRAIEFLYHLKGLLRYGSAEEDNEASSPKQIGLGAGIHIGKVAFAVAFENNRSIIKQIEGFDINYAKRVESCSRIGKYSRIFLSKEAAKLLEDKPIVFTSTNASMKGIEENTKVYEVQSGLFSGLKMDTDIDKCSEVMIERVKELAYQPIKIEEPWNKSLIISVLDCLIRDTIVSDRKKEYRELQLNLAWHSSIEDDPILLYLRARDFEEKRQYTQQLRYLKQIAHECPDFVHAKKRLIKSCWAITKRKSERSELVFARDLAKEFLEKFPHLLSEEEKKDYRKLVKAISRKARNRK
jgi:class 3 adenylate cyclase